MAEEPERRAVGPPRRDPGRRLLGLPVRARLRPRRRRRATTSSSSHGVTVVVDPFSAPYLQGARSTSSTASRSPGSRSTTRTRARRAAAATRSRSRRARSAPEGTQAAAAAPAARTSADAPSPSIASRRAVSERRRHHDPRRRARSGLAAAYYAGHRDASVRIVESLEQLGGQVAADLSGEARLRRRRATRRSWARTLVDLCVEQGLQYGADVHPRRGGRRRSSGSAQNGEERPRADDATQGEPLPLPRADRHRRATAPSSRASSSSTTSTRWEGTGLHYVVTAEGRRSRASAA